MSYSDTYFRMEGVYTECTRQVKKKTGTSTYVTHIPYTDINIYIRCNIYIGATVQPRHKYEGRRVILKQGILKNPSASYLRLGCMVTLYIVVSS